MYAKDVHEKMTDFSGSVHSVVSFFFFYHSSHRISFFNTFTFGKERIEREITENNSAKNFFDVPLVRQEESRLTTSSSQI